MICTITEEQLIAYSFNELSLDEQLEISKHIASCNQCQKIMLELKGLENVWNNPNQQPISNSIADNVLDAIMSDATYSSKKMNIFMNSKLKTVTNLVAASAATAALLYTGVFNEIPNAFASFASLLTDTTNSLHLATLKGTYWISNLSLQFSNYLNLFNF